MLDLNRTAKTIFGVEQDRHGEFSVDEVLLAVHYDLDRVWLASTEDDEETKRLRVATFVVSALRAATALGFCDLETLIREHLKELTKK